MADLTAPVVMYLARYRGWRPMIRIELLQLLTLHRSLKLINHLFHFETEPVRIPWRGARDLFM